MQYRQLGRWGVRVSTVSLGSWLTYGGSVGEDAARECVERAYDLGVNFFDTANVYSGGAAEELMGRALTPYDRDTYVLATKVYFPVRDHPNGYGLSRKHIVEQLHLSLQRLGVDYVDLYQCHRFDAEVPVEETCRTMDDLVRQGKILYWGVSEWSADQIAHAVGLCRSEGWAVPVSNQPQYSALWRKIELRVLPTCADVGMGNVVWSPLAGGILTGKYATPAQIPDDSRAAGSDAVWMREWMTPEVLDAVQALRPIADEAGCTLAQLSLAWCLRQPMVSSVIVGATKTSHVDDNVAAADLALDDEVFARVDALLEPVAR